MEKKLNQLVAYIKRESQPSLLREAFKITIQNGRLVIFITFIMFAYYSLMNLADDHVLEPVLTNFMVNSMLLAKNGTFADSDPTIHKAILKDLRFILAFKFAEWSFLCLVLMFSAAASVHSTYEAYTAKALGLKEAILGIKGKIKRPLKTTIWMVVISLASAAFLFFAVGVIGIMTEGSLSSNSTKIVLISAALYYFYLFSLWVLSLVISVLEENLSGIKAIYQANDLMKGKRLKGFGLMVLLMLVSAAMYMIFAFLVDLSGTEKAKLVGKAIIILKIWPYCLMTFFVFVVYTLYYHECKKSHQVEEVPNLYAPVSAIAEF
ncbi:hypothetical protein ACH5RR_003773 [Cinchona calisaya]|uniref:YihY/virulence factor BrkB family protein n=1 Tax=Cinchona calisaya TaxID=153742 RepID=A0ABD3AVP2_9GENT